MAILRYSFVTFQDGYIIVYKPPLGETRERNVLLSITGPLLGIPV